MQIKRFGLGLLAAAASLAWAGTAFAGVAVPARLDGTFLFEDQSQTDANQACVVVDDGFFGVFGEVVGTSGACTVEIGYNATVPHKASGTVLKDDNTGDVRPGAKAVDAAAAVALPLMAANGGVWAVVGVAFKETRELPESEIERLRQLASTLPME